MSADRLRPEDIDAAIAASQGQGRRHGARLDPEDLTAVEPGYRVRTSQEPGLGAGADGGDDAGIPPYPRRPRPDIVYAEEETRRGGGRLWTKLVAGLAVAGFGVIIWWAYGTEAPADPDAAPLITAEAGPEKIKPADEGGMEVPYQENLVYSQVGSGQDSETVERLLPPPESPIEPPAPVVRAPELPPESTAEATAHSAAPAETAPAAMAAETAPEAGAPNPPALPSTPVETAPLDDGAPEGISEEVMPSAPAAVAAPAPDAEEAAPAPPVQVAETAPEAPEAAPAEPAPQVAAVPTDGFRVQLAALRTRDAAQTAWSTLQGRHPELLNALQLTVIEADLGDKGIFFRVQAGPLPDRAAAQSLCDRLEQRDQACLIVKP